MSVWNTSAYNCWDAPWAGVERTLRLGDRKRPAKAGMVLPPRLRHKVLEYAVRPRLVLERLGSSSCRSRHVHKTWLLETRRKRRWICHPRPGDVLAWRDGGYSSTRNS